MQYVGEEGRSEVKGERKAGIYVFSHGTLNELQNRLNEVHIEQDGYAL